MGQELYFSVKIFPWKSLFFLNLLIHLSSFAKIEFRGEKKELEEKDSCWHR